MTTQNITTVEVRDNAYETPPVFGWGWPDEVRLAVFAEQTDRATKVDRMEQTDRTLENDVEYAALYFVS